MCACVCVLCFNFEILAVKADQKERKRYRKSVRGREREGGQRIAPCVIGFSWLKWAFPRWVPAQFCCLQNVYNENKFWLRKWDLLPVSLSPSLPVNLQSSRRSSCSQLIGSFFFLTNYGTITFALQLPLLLLLSDHFHFLIFIQVHPLNITKMGYID